MQNKKVVDYQVHRIANTDVDAHKPEHSTQKKVDELLANGWQPWGSPAPRDGTGVSVLQAFVKYGS